MEGEVHLDAVTTTAENCFSASRRKISMKISACCLDSYLDATHPFDSFEITPISGATGHTWETPGGASSHKDNVRRSGSEEFRALSPNDQANLRDKE
jgi:hypothetical protein